MSESKVMHQSADEVLQTLLDGNKRFVAGKLEHPNHCEESRQSLIQGQEPIAAVLSCADSRVPPVDIFDQGLGDLFVVRVAGNIFGDHTLGSLEYAVAHLHTPLILVLAHSSCGAVTAVDTGAELEGHMATLAPPIQAAGKKVTEQGPERTNCVAKENARMVADKLAKSEPVIADFVERGDVKVVPVYYDLTSGEVSVL